MFHVGFIYFFHYDKFLKFLKSFTNLNDLKIRLVNAFQNTFSLIEFQVLGLFGKLFSGPWMSTFYTSVTNQLSIVDGIQIVRQVIIRLEEELNNPIHIVNRTHEFLGNPINFNNQIEKLMKAPQNLQLFTSMIEACLQGIIAVLQRQYHKQITNINKLKKFHSDLS